MTRIALGLVLLLLAGCAGQPLSPQQVAAIKRVGIVSSVGDEMMTMDVPLMGIGATTTKGPITDLGLDPYVVEQVGGKLKDRYQVVPVTYRSADFRTDRLSVSIGEAVRDRTKLPADDPKPVDAYIVLTTEVAQVTNSGRRVRGAFLVADTSVAGHRYMAGVIYKMSVIDGHSFKTLTALNAVAGDFVSESYWADTATGMSPAQRDKLKQELQDQMNSSIRPMLKRLPLIE